VVKTPQHHKDKFPMSQGPKTPYDERRLVSNAQEKLATIFEKEKRDPGSMKELKRQKEKNIDRTASRQKAREEKQPGKKKEKPVILVSDQKTRPYFAKDDREQSKEFVLKEDKHRDKHGKPLSLKEGTPLSLHQLQQTLTMKRNQKLDVSYDDRKQDSAARHGPIMIMREPSSATKLRRA
jgi:hypothetical protein